MREGIVFDGGMVKAVPFAPGLMQASGGRMAY